MSLCGHFFILADALPSWKSPRLVVKFVKSNDGGDTFSAPQVAVSGMTPLGAVLPSTDGWPHLPPRGHVPCTDDRHMLCRRNNEVMVAWAHGRETDGMGGHVSRIFYRRSIM